MDLKARLKDSLVSETWAVVASEIVQSITQRAFLWTWGIIAIVFAVAYYIVWMIKWWVIDLNQYMIAFRISAVAWLWLVIAISWGYQKMSYATLSVLTIIFALAEWVWLAGVLSAYGAASVINAFAWAALLFVVMWIYGYVTKTDLTKFWTILLAWLITLVILEVVNMFIGSSQMDMILSWVWVLLFMWLTAWDLQMLKLMAVTWDRRLELVFWVSLYLDFINLFLMILDFIGNRN